MNTKNLIKESFNKKFKDLKISNIESLTPDASSRRYFRIYLESKYRNSFDTIMAMYFTDLKASELGKSIIKANDAVEQLGHFFLSHNISVPEIFKTDENIFFIED